MDFKIVYYKNRQGKCPVEVFLLKLGTTNKLLQAQTFKALEKIRFNEYQKEPLSKHLESGLWELRVRSKSDILRIIYTFNKGQIIILLHGFIKKQQKTPKEVLEIARKRLKEIKLREVN